MRLAPALLALLVAGCVATPQYTDPLATLTVRKAESRYSSLTLGVVISENTQQALKHMAEAGNLMRVGNPGGVAEMDPRGLTDRLTRTLSARFKSVDVAVSPAEPRHSDLRMIFDARVTLGKMSGMQTSVELSGIFVDQTRAVIDTVEGKGAATIPWPAFTTKIQPALDAAFEAFGKNLDAAPKLAAFLTAPPPAKTAASAAPLTKVDVAGLVGISWALVVGINDYRHAERLNYAVNDARSVAQALGGLGFQQVRVLIDGEATKAAIERVIYDEFKQKMSPNDRLFVFFAGHGMSVNLPRGGEEGYLIPVDGDPARPELTAIAMDEIRKMGKRVSAKHVFFAIDSCFSGFALTRDVAVAPRADAEIASALAEPVVQVMTAGRKGQKAVEEEGHGVFTKRLLDALNGAADRDGRGFLTATQLAAWVGPRVTRDSAGRQHPQFGALEGEGDFVFLLPPRTP